MKHSMFVGLAETDPVIKHALDVGIPVFRVIALGAYKYEVYNSKITEEGRIELITQFFPKLKSIRKDVFTVDYKGGGQVFSELVYVFDMNDFEDDTYFSKSFKYRYVGSTAYELVRINDSMWSRFKLTVELLVMLKIMQDAVLEALVSGSVYHEYTWSPSKPLEDREVII